MKKTLPVGGIKYGIRWVMLQIGSCCNNHLIINVIFKRLGVKAGKDSLPFAIFVTQNKENEYTRTLRHFMLQIGSRASATQTILSKVVKVVQVNNATDANIARSVLLLTTHTKPIFLTLTPKSLN